MSELQQRKIIEGGSLGNNHSLMRPPSQASKPDSPPPQNSNPQQEKVSYEYILDQQLRSNGLKDTLRTIREKLLAYCFLRLKLDDQEWNPCKDRLKEKLRTLILLNSQKDEWKYHIQALEQISQYSIQGVIQVFGKSPYLAEMQLKHFLRSVKVEIAQIQDKDTPQQYLLDRLSN